MTDYRWKSLEDDSAQHAPPPLLKEWQAFLIWTGAVTMGLTAGMFLYAITGELLIGTAAMGLLIGWMQMLVLTLQQARTGWWWVLNTTLAFVTWGMALPIFREINLLSGLALGVLVGVLQWLSLRKHVEQSLWWLLANIAAWLVAMSLYLPLTILTGTWFIGIALTGLVAGALLAGAILWLLRFPTWQVKDEAPLKDNYQS